MARIQVGGTHNTLADIETGRALSVLDNNDSALPKSLYFQGLSGEFVFVHLAPQDVKKLRVWALQQSINEL